MPDDMIISEFALALCRNHVDTYELSGVNKLLNESDCEDTYISICNILFAFYRKQYHVASDDNQRKSVSKLFASMYNKVFAGKYMTCDTASRLFFIACNIENGEILKNSINNITGCNDLEKYIATCKYVYRFCINYIVNSGIFHIEPYTSIMENMLLYIKTNTSDVTSLPNYFS